MNCDRFQERLLDFLYEEMSAAERAEADEHIRGCAACGAEVSGHQRSLGQARAALRGPLMQEPPARVHQAILAAAQAAAQSAHPATARPSHKPADEGFFARLWRTPWLIPAFGAASIATAVFLVKVLKNPEVLPARSTAQPALAPFSQGEEAVPASPRESGERQPRPGRGGEGQAAGYAEGQHFAPPQPPARRPSPEVGKMGKATARPTPSSEFSANAARAKEKRVFFESDDLSGTQESPTGAPTARFAAPPPGGGNAPSERGKTVDELLAAAPAAPAPKAMATGRALPAAEPSFAAEPVHASAGKQGKAALAADDELSADSKKESASEQLAKAHPRAAKHKVFYEIDSAPAKQDRDDKPSGAASASLAASVQKADRLFAKGDWDAAADAYQDLLKRFPRDPQATKWRERLDASRLAKQERQAEKNLLINKKKTLSSDPLDGLKK
jgi:hypothetical protein